MPTPEKEKPRQKLVVLPEFCTHAAGSECTRCRHCCPHGAISLPDDLKPPKVDHGLCSGCGICFGVCDAFASTRMSLFDLHARIRRIASDGERVYLTCNENVFPGFEVDHNVVVLPCLSMLSPELWTLVLAEGIRMTIACDLKYCEDCSRGGDLGGELFARAVEIAEERTGEKVLFTFRIPEKKSLIGKYAENGTSDRRDVFTGFAVDAAEIATGKRRLRNSEVLKDYYQRKERQRAAMRLHLASESPYGTVVPAGKRKRLMFPKQQLVLESIDARPDIASCIPVALSCTDHSSCTLSGECASACPTGARCVDDGAVKVDAHFCIGCGICVDTCEQGACSIEEDDATALLHDNANKPREI